MKEILFPSEPSVYFPDWSSDPNVFICILIRNYDFKVSSLIESVIIIDFKETIILFFVFMHYICLNNKDYS